MKKSANAVTFLMSPLCNCAAKIALNFMQGTSFWKQLVRFWGELSILTIIGKMSLVRKVQNM